MANDADVALDRVLPADVVAAGNHAWSRYRTFPAFSAPWLAGRTRVFAIVVGTVALVVGFGRGVLDRDYPLGALGGVYLFVSFMLMATAGPAFATWVRHRRWSPRVERRAIVAAVLAGIVVSGAVDWWASSQLDRLFELSVSYGEAPKRPPPGTAERIVATAVNVVVLFVIYGLLGGGLALRTYFGEARRVAASRQRHELDAARLREREVEQRLALLQAQIEPHFLFNTLASIRALVAQSPPRAEAALDALVAYLRAAIPQWREGDNGALSTLGRQLDLAAAYLELMQARMGERLSFDVAAPDELRERPFPPLVIVGLVENAIKHGLEPKAG
ncbi:MAG TPA: sensor histidine kinase, partial [Tahibacter sp.]|nr:sensor histidine kinase [Tahibacter sp.]